MHNSGPGINLRQGDKVRKKQYRVVLTLLSNNRHCMGNVQHGKYENGN